MHLWNTYPESRYTCWHTKNEDIPHRGETKKEYVIRRSQDKALGLLPGVWDLVMYRTGKLYIFDVKVGKDKLSDSQIRFRDMIIQNGGEAYEINDLESFIEITKNIFNGNA